MGRILAFLTSLVMAILGWFNSTLGLDLVKIELPCDQAAGYTWKCEIGDEQIATLQKTEFINGKQVFYFKPAQKLPDDTMFPNPTVVTFTSTKDEKTEYALKLETMDLFNTLTVYSPDSFRSATYSVTAENPVEGGMWSLYGGYWYYGVSTAGPATVAGATRDFQFLWLTNTPGKWVDSGVELSDSLAILNYGMPGEVPTETKLLAVSIDKNGIMKTYDETKMYKIELPYTISGNGGFSSGEWYLGSTDRYEPVQPENFEFITSPVISWPGEYVYKDGITYFWGDSNVPLSGNDGFAFIPRSEGTTKVTFYDESAASYPVEGVTPTKYITYVFTVDSELNVTVTVDKSLTTADIPG